VVPGGEPQVLGRGAARHDELAPVGVRDGQRAGRIAAHPHLVALEVEPPGLAVVARGREDRPAEELARLRGEVARRGERTLGLEEGTGRAHGRLLATCEGLPPG